MMCRHHNCIRLKFEKAGPVPPSEVFGRTVLLQMLEFKAEDLYCLISLTRGFDVSFQTTGGLAKFWVRWTTALSAGLLADCMV